ncbi:MAG TPA: acetylhydrolase [Thermoanaerobaculia bacterium]|nr:acetylhydrolase [Thermoanaerobaculia bacterium]
MIRKCLVSLGFALLLAFPLSAKPAPAPAPAKVYEGKPGSYAVATVSYDWTDSTRNRKVPVKIYYPEKGPGPFPVIVFSHGLGGTREGYEYLGRHWASCGYVSVHVQHLGSDDAVWRESQEPARDLVRAAADVRNAMNRPQDVSFALDRIAAMNKDATPLRGRLDLHHIGMAGHSFGAWTTLVVAGQALGLRQERSLADRRIEAAIEMSAPVPRDADLDRAYAKITIPILHMTGTLDDSPIGDTKAAERRIPFDHVKAAGQYLVTFQGGDHMTFAGVRRRPVNEEKDARFHDLILQGTTAFWDAYLKGDAAAKSWLARGGYAAAMGSDGKLEVK